MKKKLIIIGVDGFDPDLIWRWRNELPALKGLIESGSFNPISSVFPPDSIPAWASIYTGKDPSEHGIIDSINYLDKEKFENIQIDQFELTGKTFWDKLSGNSKSVCIINPFICYPAWDVNGLMLSGPSLNEGPPSISGKFLFDVREVPHLGGIPHFPTKDELNEFIEFNKKNTLDVAQLGHKLFSNKDWDLFFIYFLTLDRIKHFLWRYCDETDPTYPGENEFNGTIKEFYKLYDEIIGKFLNYKSKDKSVMIISDHGHQKRCTKVFNINEFFRQNKWLMIPYKEKGVRSKVALEKLKVFVLHAMDKYNCQDIVFKFVRFIPNRKALKKSSYIIDKKQSLCFASEFCSTNPAGGIELNRQAIEKQGLNYDSFVEEVIGSLRKIKDPSTEDTIFDWVDKRDSLFTGKYREKFPPVLFNLKEEYGTNWNLFTELISVNVTHKKISGGHRKKGVFLFDKPVNNTPLQITDLNDFVLSYFQ